MTRAAYDTLSDAFAVLETVPGVPVKIAGEPIPQDVTRLITVDYVVATNAADFEPGDATRLQVNTFADTLFGAIELAQTAEATLTPHGYTRRDARRTPQNEGDALTGISTDYTR